MGIESDQLVFDYLSRVGDLAQQRQLPSGERMNLVAELREEIGRQRSKTVGGGDSPAAVRRILKRMGTPDEIVDRAGGTVPTPRSATAASPQDSKAPVNPVDPGNPANPEDWWAEGPQELPGFVGGVELAEILRPPAEETEDPADEEPEETGQEDPPQEEPRRGLRLPALSRASFPNPMLLLAAALLVAGAALGSLLPLAAGWLLAYASRRLTPFESKLAVLGLPGVAAAGGILWIWGRLNGRWGAPIPPGGEALTQAMAATWPWTLRTAAIASALYLLWRSRRA
ncbi:HAAS signaling domain-containing protein [Streptomyces sp. NPDC048604]|uniref:HAAS signaling domain-containing protein n=1 Tax=Streptomyces sp. NPDC048604 TaxID=3365578 RepID=UPI00371CEBEB